MSFSVTREHLDSVGSALSTACAIHCSIKPLLFLLPSVAWFDFLLSPRFEGMMLTTGVLLALGSVSWGYTHHRNPAVLLALAAGFVLLGIGQFGVPHGWVERLLVVPGGLLVALTHVLNARLCRCCRRSR